MKTTVFLIADRNGVQRLVKRWPALARNEIGIALRVEIPDSAFRSPVLTVDLTVPEGRVIQPDIEIEACEIGGE